MYIKMTRNAIIKLPINRVIVNFDFDTDKMMNISTLVHSIGEIFHIIWSISKSN